MVPSLACPQRQTMAVLRAAITSLLFVAACDVGEVPASGASPAPDAGGGGGSDAAGSADSGSPTGAEATFNSQIKQMVMRCANPGCHATGGQKPTLDAYTPLADQLRTQYTVRPGNTNVLVTKGKAAGNHSNMPWLSGTEQTALGNWIDSLQ